MEITINNIKQSENDQNVYFTLTDDNGNDYQWHGDVPLGQDVVAHLNNRIDEIWKLILGKRYPTIYEKDITVEGTEEVEEEFNIPIKFNGVAEVETWITDNNPKEIPWKSTHPVNLDIESRIDAAKDITDLKTILKDMIK